MSLDDSRGAGRRCLSPHRLARRDRACHGLMSENSSRRTSSLMRYSRVSLISLSSRVLHLMLRQPWKHQMAAPENGGFAA